MAAVDDNPSAHTVDKTRWADGPWMTEPDYVSWVDEATGLDCLVVRNRMGALCGYVGMPVGHPWFGMHYDEVPQAMDSAAHGGLTYSSECAGHICHDSPNEVWWLGFDCGHYGDLDGRCSGGGAPWMSLPGLGASCELFGVPPNAAAPTRNFSSGPCGAASCGGSRAGSPSRRRSGSAHQARTRSVVDSGSTPRRCRVSGEVLCAGEACASALLAVWGEG